jgi:hypothetical protein
MIMYVKDAGLVMSVPKSKFTLEQSRQYARDYGRPNCDRCGEELHPDRTVWLELNHRTGKYTTEDVPEEESQGCFPFGVACSKRVIVERKKQ